MLKTLLFTLLAAVSIAPQARALDFDGKAGGFFLNASLPSLELPAARPVPAPETKAAGCRPFLLALSAGGVGESVVMERACTPGNEAVWALIVENTGNRKIAARVASDKYPEERALIEKRIKTMVAEGMTQADADVVVGKVGPLLERAAAAPRPGQDALIAEAVMVLKEHLARP